MNITSNYQLKSFNSRINNQQLNANPNFGNKQQVIEAGAKTIAPMMAATAVTVLAIQNGKTEQKQEIKFTREMIKEIFDNNAFNLEESQSTAYDIIYIKDKQNNTLCTIGGKKGTGNIDYAMYPTLPFYWNPLSKDGALPFIAAIMENLSKDKQDLLFSSKLFDINKPETDIGFLKNKVKRMEHEKQKAMEREKRKVMEELMLSLPCNTNALFSQLYTCKPSFGIYHSQGAQSIQAVSMREYLTVSATDKEQYIGTLGLGPCIGLALVSKKYGNPVNITIAHIDSMTDLGSLKELYDRSMKNSSELDITLISSGNNKEMATEILLKLKTLGAENIQNISTDLTCSRNFAINTKTGEVCINLPNEDFTPIEILSASEYKKFSPLVCAN